MNIIDAREISALVKEYDELTALLKNQEDDDEANRRVNHVSNALHDSIFAGYDAPLNESLNDAVDEAMAAFADEGIWDAIRTRRDTVAALLIVRGVEIPNEPDAGPVSVDDPDAAPAEVQTQAAAE